MVKSLWFPQIDEDGCTGCGDCIIACPTDALELVRGTAVLADPEACNYCGYCEAICPERAIAIPYKIELAASL